MKNPLAIRLFSRRALTDSHARDQILALSDFAGGLMRPDKCSEVEPIRVPFDPADLSVPVQWLAKPGGSFMYRKGAPVEASGVMWNLARPSNARFPSPSFTNYWTGEFDQKWATQNGIKILEEFLCSMLEVTASDFAILTTEADLNAKNRPPGSFSYAGLGLDNGIPGLYWINLFSEALAEWLGLGGLPQEIARWNRLPDGGLRLKFCESPDDCRNIEILQRQQVVIEWLGRDRFFDVRFPDRKLKAPFSAQFGPHAGNTMNIC